ncbi:MAG: protein kinase [Gemmataceae bacterium]
MRTVCGHCGQTLEFSSHAPTFCAYCGVRLTSSIATTTPPPAEATVAYTGSTEADPDAAAPPAGAPASIGGYALRRVLGVGGMGTVYEGIDSSGQSVAVKLLSPQLAKNAASLERFRQEGRLASSVSHPHCVFVLAADEDAGRPYIVMELMPGRTLREEVELRGPLPPLEAIAKILDVIDGLSEAHRLGILHRDVKPSNCFVMPDGRVKVGDFGLSKSLTTDVNLTQSGSFLGTVLYAAPEQIRGYGVDFAADVYAVSATLYFLLTGRAPFQHESAAAVLARVVSEDPPPIRKRRPEVSSNLECVVLRGLERNKDKRYQTLDELRDALRMLLPAAATRGSLALRFAAFLIDSSALVAPNLLIHAVFRLGIDTMIGRQFWLGQSIAVAVEFAYFALAEGLFGCTPGKFIMRLRVAVPGTTDRPSWPAIFRRTAVFVAITHLHLPLLAIDSGRLLSALLQPLVWIPILATMRRTNGYRGLHELASGTQVALLPWAAPRRILSPIRPRTVPPLSDRRIPPYLGPFEVQGVLADSASTCVLLGEDTTLKRAVHLWVRPTTAPATTESRRSLGRSTRPRWLSSGTTDGRQWDAFLAPSGGSLRDVVGPRAALSWTETRRLLEQLTEELDVSAADGSRPVRLTIDQIWLQPDGRMQLLDAFTPPNDAAVVSDVDFVGRVAALALEGELQSEHRKPGPVQAVVPPHAASFLTELTSGTGFATLADVRSALAQDHDRPTETSRPMRLAHLGVQGLLLLPLLAVMAVLPSALSAAVLVAIGLSSSVVQDAVQIARTPDQLDEAQRQKLAAAGNRDEVITALDGIMSELRASYERRAGLMNVAERYAVEQVSRTRLRLDPEVRTEQIERAFDLAGHRIQAHGNSTSVDEVFVGQIAEVLLSANITVCVAICGMWIFWAFLTRGGLSLYFMGLCLVRANGHRAARWQCLWRALLVWMPIAILFSGLAVVKLLAPERTVATTALFWSTILVLVGYIFLALRQPERGPHDRLAGTYVVPR